MLTRTDKKRLLEEWPFFDPAEESGFAGFEDAKSLVIPLGINSAGEYRREVRVGRLSSRRIPVNPQVVYADDGWNGWDDFFGIRLTYEDAVVAVRGLKITSGSAYKEAHRNGLLPHGMPKNPASFFKDRWGGWGVFLGCVASFAEKSRRTKDGLHKARLAGTKIGRPAVSIHRVKEAKSLREQGLSLRVIGRRMGISGSAVFRLVHLSDGHSVGTVEAPVTGNTLEASSVDRDRQEAVA